MKYIKQYEGLIKKNDSRVSNHILLPLSNVIEDMMKTLSQLENIDISPVICKVKKYFSTVFNDSINIKLFSDIYNVNNYRIGHLFKITLSAIDDTYSLYLDVSSNDTGDRTKRREIKSRLQDFMEKYVSRSNYLYAGGKNEFTENDIPDIIAEFEKITSELQIEIETNKYNI